MKVESEGLILEEILRANDGRKPALVRRKLGLMAAGPFAFYRGTDHLFALDWPALRPLDPGPQVLLCGDLHLENFGAFLTDEGDCRFGINDFDEACVAHAGIDVVRCAASILLAAGEWKLSPTAASAIVLEFLDRYREQVAASSVSERSGQDEGATYPAALLDLLLPTALASRDVLLARLTVAGKGGAGPAIRRDSGKSPIRPKKLAAIRSAFEALASTSEVHRSIEVLDATTRVAGLGSLGLRHYLVLVKGGSVERMRLLDVKEAAPTSLRACLDAPQPSWGRGEASRVINAERLINERPEGGLAAIDIGRRSYRVREMIPEANRSSLSRLRRDPRRLLEAVRAAGGIAAWGHVRGARALDPGRAKLLADWAMGPAFDAVMVAGARAAARTEDQFEEFRRSIGRKSVRKRLGLPGRAPEPAGAR